MDFDIQRPIIEEPWAPSLHIHCIGRLQNVVSRRFRMQTTMQSWMFAWPRDPRRKSLVLSKFQSIFNRYFFNFHLGIWQNSTQWCFEMSFFLHQFLVFLVGVPIAHHFGDSEFAKYWGPQRSQPFENTSGPDQFIGIGWSIGGSWCFSFYWRNPILLYFLGVSNLSTKSEVWKRSPGNPTIFGFTMFSGDI